MVADEPAPLAQTGPGTEAVVDDVRSISCDSVVADGEIRRSCTLFPHNAFAGEPSFEYEPVSLLSLFPGDVADGDLEIKSGAAGDEHLIQNEGVNCVVDRIGNEERGFRFNIRCGEGFGD